MILAKNGKNIQQLKENFQKYSTNKHLSGLQIEETFIYTTSFKLLMYRLISHTFVAHMAACWINMLKCYQI